MVVSQAAGARVSSGSLAKLPARPAPYQGSSTRSCQMTKITTWHPTSHQRKRIQGPSMPLDLARSERLGFDASAGFQRSGLYSSP